MQVWVDGDALAVDVLKTPYLGPLKGLRTAPFDLICLRNRKSLPARQRLQGGNRRLLTTTDAFETYAQGNLRTMLGPG
jgi:hypothetical protein